MSEKVAKEVQNTVDQAAVGAAWCQWGSLTSMAIQAGAPRATSIVDPEALILLSLAFRERERRLEDLLLGWARTGSGLTSVQRMLSVMLDFPEPTRERVGDWALHAAEAGDRRWRKLVRDPLPGTHPLRRKPWGPPEFHGGPSLMLRLRAGFGVGAKSDVLCFLLGMSDASASIRAIANATKYTERAVRNAAEEMALAGFIQELHGWPSEFRVDALAWAPVLSREAEQRAPSGRGMPPWRSWAPIFAFLTNVASWAVESSGEGRSPYLQATTARDIYERHHVALRKAGVEFMSPEGLASAKGAEFLEPFARWVSAGARWIGENL
jgi:hypothetical protein